MIDALLKDLKYITHNGLMLENAKVLKDFSKKQWSMSPKTRADGQIKLKPKENVAHKDTYVQQYIVQSVL